MGDFGGTWFNSENLNETEYDSYVFNILTLQTKGENYDMQLSFFNRYTDVHFVPDIYGDLVFNDVASNVTRQSLLNGVQFDGAYRLNDVHTLRAGFAGKRRGDQGQQHFDCLATCSGWHPFAVAV